MKIGAHTDNKFSAEWFPRLYSICQTPLNITIYSSLEILCEFSQCAAFVRNEILMHTDDLADQAFILLAVFPCNLYIPDNP